MRSTLRIEPSCNPDPIERPAGNGITFDELRRRLLDAESTGGGHHDPAVLAGLLAVIGGIVSRAGDSDVEVHLVPVDAMGRPAGPLVEPG